MNKQVPNPGIMALAPVMILHSERKAVPNIHIKKITHAPIPRIANPMRPPIQLTNPQMTHPIQTPKPTRGIKPKHRANPSIAKNPQTTIGMVSKGTTMRMKQISMRRVMRKMRFSVMKMAMERMKTIRKVSKSNTSPQSMNKIISGSQIIIVIIIPSIRAIAADTGVSHPPGIAPAKNTKKATSIQYNINIYSGKNNIVSGKHRHPIKSQISIMIATIIIPGHEMITPIKIALRRPCIIPRIIAIIHPITLHGIKQKQVKIKQIIPKQNTT
jgi:hypothetical protein